MKNTLLRLGSVVSAIAITAVLVTRAASCTGDEPQTPPAPPPVVPVAEVLTAIVPPTNPPPPTTVTPTPPTPAATTGAAGVLDANSPAFLGATKSAGPILRVAPPPQRPNPAQQPAVE